VLPRSAGTTYYVHLMLDGSQTPGSSQIFNNHIPLDPQILGSLAISKTTPQINVTRGQLVPYTITVNNLAGMLLTGVSIVDRLPAGFSYIKGSALLDGVPTEPSVAGGALSWDGLVIAGTQVRTVRLLLAVGAGVTEGEFVNRAQALLGVSGNAMSGEATATVRLVPDPTFDCTDVTGKVFNDANRNGWQDDGEEGLPGVRVVTARGLAATTDQYGRYHITCAITPNESRGSNFVLKLDDRTLPSGYRMSTDQVQIKRATAGKALRANFGASIQRVVAIDLLDAAFEPGKTEIRVQWRPRLNLLVEELRKAPAVLRLSYVADTEDAALVKRRVEAFKRQLTEAWGAANSSYVLTIEPEVFWRRGAPPKQPEVRVPESR
jgi:large repetitive protein